MKRQTVILFFIGFLVIEGCYVSKQNVDDQVLLRLNPQIGSTYEISTNVNIALDMKQPVNVNMEFYIRTSYDSLLPDGNYAITSEISRVKAIISSSIFHRSYDSDHPVIEGETEQMLHDRLSKLVHLKINGKINSIGEISKTANLDSLFNGDEEMKKQFGEIEKTFSNSGILFPIEAVKKGSIWKQIVIKKGAQELTQEFIYKVKKITKQEIFIDVFGTISYGNKEVKGGGEIKGFIRLNRQNGINTSSRINQDYKMDINGYKATGVNTIETKSQLIN